MSLPGSVDSVKHPLDGLKQPSTGLKHVEQGVGAGFSRQPFILVGKGESREHHNRETRHSSI